MYDILIVGGGPAGVSAALTAANRGRSVLVLGNDFRENPLARAPRVDNYPGLAGSGLELLEAMHRQLAEREIPTAAGRVQQAMAAGGAFACAAGSEVYEGRSLILCIGQARGEAVEGEAALLGRGVSGCATCDGMLYRGKDVAVLGSGREAVEDANFLRDIGCRVRFFARGARPEGLGKDIPFHSARRFRITGGERAECLEADGTAYAVQGVFVLRPTVAADSLLPGLETADGHIRTGRGMETSIPGVFAAGDCAGKPYQISKAAGEGCIAALSADRFIATKGET